MKIFQTRVFQVAKLYDRTRELAEELQKATVIKFEKLFIDYNWGADLADMQLISKFSQGIYFLLCDINIFNKYAWDIPLKEKNGIRITNDFQKTLDESNPKPNKIWVDKGSEFYNRLVKLWLKENAIEMYSTHKEGKSVVLKEYRTGFEE